MTSTQPVAAHLWAAPRPDGLWQVMGAWRHHMLYAEAPIGDPQPHQVAADVIRWRRAQPFHYRPPRQFRTRTPRKARAMPTYTASISRDDSEQLTLSRPEDAPDWVSELVDDVVWKFEESPDARSVSLTIQAGADQTQAGTTTTTGQNASEVLTGDPNGAGSPTYDETAQATGTTPDQPDQTAGQTAAAGQAPAPGAQTTSPGDPGTPDATAGTGPTTDGSDTSVQTAAAAPEAGDGTDQPPPAGTTGDVPGSDQGTTA